MALLRPTQSELVELIRGDADALLGGIDSRLQRGLVEVALLAQVGAIHSAYGFLQQNADDLFADTATSEALERLASIYGISRAPGTFAKGWIGLVTNTTPGVMPVGTILRRGDGREFVTIAGSEIPDGSFFLVPGVGLDGPSNGFPGHESVWPVQSVESGASGNTLAGSTISLVSPIAGVPSVFEVAVGIAGAVDFETDDSLRGRLLARLRNPPQGGTAAEYEAWALAATDADDPISRAFVVPPASGSNVVTVYIADDGGAIPSANPPTPSAQAITNAKAAIDARRPLSSDVDVLAPTFVAITPTINLAPDTADIRTAIENEIDSFFLDNHEPGQEVPISILQAVVSNAAGGGDAQITAPTSNYTPGPTELLYRGAITWTP